MIKEEDFDANLAGEDGVTEETKRSWFMLQKGFGLNVLLVNIPAQ
jgi:hypothetical protein